VEDLMQRRPFGASGMMVSAIGLGAWQLGSYEWDNTDEGEALEIVQSALDLGCDFFDTAPSYGGGRSEELLGKALKGRRHAITLCTKFGRTTARQPQYDVAYLRSSLEDSLKRLQTDYVDILVLHSPPRELMDGTSAPHYEVLEQLKAEGKLRVYGVSVDTQAEIETLLTTTNCGAIEVLFNIFHQEPLPAFQKAVDKGVGLIAKVPLDSGWLSGKYRGGEQFADLRRRWSPEVIERRAALVEQLAEILPKGVPMTQAALQYVLAQPTIATAIPGARSVTQVRENTLAGESGLPSEVVQAIYSFWEREIKSNPVPW
jgi:aryl-alcohol dehydrogenase-like predicted oxidoreductase